MGRGFRPSAGTVLAAIALFVALGGSVYAAAAKIDGTTIKANSMPGNRVVVGSLPANRLQESSIAGDRLAPGSVTGVQVDSSTLGQVPSAAHANSADTAGKALHAVQAESAERVDGYLAGCDEDNTEEFGGACIEFRDSLTAVTAPAAAAACAARGGELPGALLLAGYAARPEVDLEGAEWTGDVTNVSGQSVYGVVVVANGGKLNVALPTELRHFRCVIPLVG